MGGACRWGSRTLAYNPWGGSRDPKLIKKIGKSKKLMGLFPRPLFNSQNPSLVLKFWGFRPHPLNFPLLRPCTDSYVVVDRQIDKLKKY